MTTMQWVGAVMVAVPVLAGVCLFVRMGYEMVRDGGWEWTDTAFFGAIISILVGFGLLTGGAPQ